MRSFWQQLKHRLRRPRQAACRAQEPDAGFDPDWYLAEYPDVAAAGIDPWLHYCRHGRAEGRLPRRNRALAWDHHLWRGADSVMVARLEGLFERSDATPEEQTEARWALARWRAWQSDWQAVVALLGDIGGGSRAHDDSMDAAGAGGPQQGVYLLLVEALCRLAEQGEGDEALLGQTLAALQARFPESTDTDLAELNALGALGDDAARLTLLNRMFARHGLAEVAVRERGAALSLDTLAAAPLTPHASPLTPHASPFTPHQPEGRSPLISVIVPLYNAEATIATALRSLFEQTWRPLEILVVDDASEDAGAEVVERLMGECPEGVSLRLLRQPENRGAYAARNLGMAGARGELLTTHDSDDWSHPEKLARQVAALQQAPEAVACLSWWVRANEPLLFHRWRLGGYGWCYPNLSSLMVRRRGFEALGFWDEVKVNADSEYRERLAAAFGEAAVIEVLPGVPLSIGRADEGSLSQHGATHLVSQFVGVRRDYMQSARRWHGAASEPEALRLPREPAWRPFPAPGALCREALPVRFRHPLDEVQASGLFDAGWYLRTHIDLQSQRIEPLAHFWEQGAAEGRDPGPGFSVSGYLARYPEVAKRVAETGINPLLHFLQAGHALGHEPCPWFAGERPRLPGRPTVLLVGHAAGASLYGAERSLVDIARALEALAHNVVVALPGAANRGYLSALQRLSLGVAVLPYGWWQSGKLPEAATVARFKALIQRHEVTLVHVNTLVLDEPLVAARELGLASLVHVRELPEHDSALCETLNATPPQLRERVLANATGVIANSRRVARWLECHPAEESAQAGQVARISVVPNTIEMAPLLALAEPSDGNGRLTVGMLSSNLPKKGLEDLESVAQHLTSLLPEARVLLFGPRTPALEALLARQAEGKAPANIVYRGYVNEPAAALAELDVVVNLSRFQESFGRTVLEAMAAARPVVAYDWGALSELVVHAETGVLVPLGDQRAAAEQLAWLGASRRSRHAMGQRGRQRALAVYGPQAFAPRLAEAYRKAGVKAV